MVASIYFGHGKPPLDSFLFPFVDELNQLIEEGLYINGYSVVVTIKCFVCDSPARSFIKGKNKFSLMIKITNLYTKYVGVVGFNSHHGCLKCEVIGEWDKNGHHMSFPRVDVRRRTDESFRNKTDEDHHKITTPLTRLPINLIEDIIIADSLHLFDLGSYCFCHSI